MLPRKLASPAAGLACLLAATPSSRRAHCAAGAEDPWERVQATADQARKVLLDCVEKRDLRPLVDGQTLEDGCVGGLLGVCSGYALKKLSRVAAFTAGTLFVVTQLATHTELVTFNKKLVAETLDKGLGAVNSGLEAAGVHWDAPRGPAVSEHSREADVLAWPHGKQAAFAVGLLYGLKHG